MCEAAPRSDNALPRSGILLCSVILGEANRRQQSVDWPDTHKQHASPACRYMAFLTNLSQNVYKKSADCDVCRRNFSYLYKPYDRTAVSLAVDSVHNTLYAIDLTLTLNYNTFKL